MALTPTIARIVDFHCKLDYRKEIGQAVSNPKFENLGDACTEKCELNHCSGLTCPHHPIVLQLSVRKLFVEDFNHLG